MLTGGGNHLGTGRDAPVAEPPQNAVSIQVARALTKSSSVASLSSSSSSAAKARQANPASKGIDAFFAAATAENQAANNLTLLNDPSFDLYSHLSHTHALDRMALREWLYPSNRPVRDYQFNVIQASMFQNTLVALPTGLGKTFIAAVVMFNFFRWFPEGKIVFMAPTKPLVAQQIEACYKITGIPQDVTDEMTGQASPEARRRSWAAKRVFFLTPQVMQNDLNRDTCPADKVVLIVVDEAHRASGKHAYCEVVRLLSGAGAKYRILALTATPGSDVKTVQNVIENLQISKIEIRTEDSLDIKPYTHERTLEVVVLPSSPEILALAETFKRVLNPHLQRLKSLGALFGDGDPKNMTRWNLMQAREAYRQKHPRNEAGSNMFMVEGDFGVLMSLCDAYTYLLQLGIKMFLTQIEAYAAEVDGKTKISKTKERLVNSADFQHMLTTARRHMETPGEVSHPKLARLVETVVGHFEAHADAKARGERDWDTRVMVFSNFRESVLEITEALAQHAPLVRVMSFVGQSSGKKNGAKGCTQKEQMQLIQTFQNGGYNVLVATCIGEEGLDIGDVDLICCFDAQNSPIRMLQRMGRTGRKREGRVVLLLSEGKEEDAHRRSQLQYKNVQKAILEGQGNKVKSGLVIFELCP
ncbi:P-loop containing nucleoside triphosphate hydrolase protein [Chytriomyces sp. MP71]|nr:P-loop containing nucleoside triphosphate hydrolase protein [Chytriomyces sp. MP71]